MRMVAVMKIRNFVIIVHIDFLLTVNHANDVEWI